MREHPAPDETLTILCQKKLKLLQKRRAYRFSLDPILLANFIVLKKQERMLDIGTGCGIIPIYMSKQYPDNSLVGVEIQKTLFNLAVKNVRLNGCENVQILHGNISSVARTFNEPFHVVVSNPPYVKRHSGRESPQHSRHLARYESSLDLNTLFAISASLLYTKGRLYIIYPAKRLAELVSAATAHGIEPRRLRLIHPRGHEPANLFLVECMKGGGAELKVERPLYIYGDGEYTDEVASYYT
ncbi:MAG TPA: methyltransferase [Syntrophorhabdales bacterium]|jgi:tRNA1(Val) A37 N6-methylase TrmN6|nr:methyltransferase [Syntrophorhabdales bacterium]